MKDAIAMAPRSLPMEGREDDSRYSQKSLPVPVIRASIYRHIEDPALGCAVRCGDGKRSPSPLTDKGRINVRAVNHRMAIGAWRQFRRTFTHAVERACGHRAMALIAQHVD